MLLKNGSDPGDKAKLFAQRNAGPGFNAIPSAVLRGWQGPVPPKATQASGETRGLGPTAPRSQVAEPGAIFLFHGTVR